MTAACTIIRPYPFRVVTAGKPTFAARIASRIEGTSEQARFIRSEAGTPNSYKYRECGNPESEEEENESHRRLRPPSSTVPYRLSSITSNVDSWTG